MAQQFLSRAAREGGVREEPNEIGPGAYNLPGSIKRSKPAFTAFSSSSKRSGELAESNKIVEITPGPGEHDVDKVLGSHWAKSIKSSFRSGTQRFKSQLEQTPGPANYTLPSSINVKKPKKYRKTKIDVDIAGLNPAVVPSIPNRHQSYGYEAGNDGKLQLQDPIVPGFAGVKADTVGPGDYNPKVDFKFKVTKGVKMSDTERNFHAGIARDRLTNPGPGYYNHASSFEDFAGINGEGNAKNDYYVKLNNSMKRHALSSFESKTKREFIDEKAMANLPGPGKYSLPGTNIAQNTEKKPQHLQCFSSSDIRFKESVPRSMRLATAPGSYNPLTSDFEMQKLKILKQKKMASRSGWVQNIAFSGTEKRFMDVQEPFNKEVGPTPASYDPKVTLIDELERNTNKFADTRVHGGFGVGAKRFEENKVINQMGALVAPRAEAAYGGQAMDAGGNINIGYEGVPSVANGGGGGQSSSLRKGKVNKPRFPTSTFVNKETRFYPVKDAPGPAPGSYDTTQKWDKAKGVLPMSKHSTESLKKYLEPDTIPGPGDYNIALTYVKKVKNRKNVLVTTSSRFDSTAQTAAKEERPTPMTYDPHGPIYGSLIKPSHNILLTN